MIGKQKKIINYNDISWSKNGVPSSIVAYVCEDCKKIKTDTVYGTSPLELEDFK